MTGYRRGIMVLAALLACVVLSGPTEAKKDLEYTGFLTVDYGKLTQDPDDKQALAWSSSEASVCDYKQALLDPVVFHLGGGTKPAEKVKEQDQEAMKQYLYAAAHNVLADFYTAATEPGPGVLRVRLAITDLLKSKVGMQLLPQTHLMGAGRGGAAMEGEMQDAITGDAIIAVVQGGKAGRVGSGVKKWSAAKDEIDTWAKKLRKQFEACSD